MDRELDDCTELKKAYIKAEDEEAIALEGLEEASDKWKAKICNVSSVNYCSDDSDCDDGGECMWNHLVAEDNFQKYWLDALKQARSDNEDLTKEMQAQTVEYLSEDKRLKKRGKQISSKRFDYLIKQDYLVDYIRKGDVSDVNLIAKTIAHSKALQAQKAREAADEAKAKACNRQVLV
jgi:hypothetical protein